jgi:hypothetical protein
MLPTALRPLTAGEVIDTTFTLYRRNFLLFFAISAVPRLATLAAGLIQTQFFGDVATAPMKNVGVTALVYTVAAVIGVFVYLFAQGGTIIAVTEIYLGRTTTMAAAFERVWNEFGTLFGVVMLSGLAIGGGLILLVVPGVYLACRLLVCVPAALIENLGPSEALSRSFDLTRDNAGRAFLVILVYTAIAFAAGTVAAIPTFVIVLSKGAPTIARTWTQLILILQFFTNSLINPLILIASSVFYFDLRIRKEAFDLQFMMDPDSAHIARVRAPGSIL